MSFVKILIATLLLVSATACESMSLGNKTSEAVFVPEDDGRILARARGVDPALFGGQGGTTTNASNPPLQTTREVIVRNSFNFKGFQDHETDARVISNETYRRGLQVDGGMNRDVFLAALKQRVDLAKARNSSMSPAGLPERCRLATPAEVAAYTEQVGNWLIAMGNRPVPQEALSDILDSFEASGSLDLPGVIAVYNRDNIVRNLTSTASSVYAADIFTEMVDAYQSRPICEMGLPVVQVEGEIPPG